MATETIKLKDIASEAQQAEAVARRYCCDFVDLNSAKIDHELFRTVPVDLMFRYHFVPLQAHNGTLEIALSDPRHIVMIDELSVLLSKKLKIKVATYSQISDLLKKTEQSQRVLEEVTEGFTLDVVGDEESGDENLSIDRLASDEGNIAPVIKLVDTTIFNALERRASDIHIETRDQELAIKYRIDGVLQNAMSPIAKEWYSAVISRIKVMSELDIAERRIPQDGRFRVRYKGRLIDFRVSIMPTIHGEDAVLRVLDKESMSEKFSKLTLDVVGFADHDLVKFRRFIKEPYGMVLVTGPTGSGKTTTLYAALSEIKNEEDKIITFEDPVEYQIKGITQIPVNEKKGLTFARGLRSILRHDPDKILVGEIRDQETAQIAINAALTGHLVFTTVHANNVLDVLGRFLNMGVEPYNFVSSLNCILAQRLVRVICPHCKQRVSYDSEYLNESGIDTEEWRRHTFFEGRGCMECSGTGFRGRTAIHEVLDLTEQIREMIMERKATSEIKRVARQDGMTFLRDSALDR
ncbi:MAG: type II/IV secretion system protein, partial [Acidobacteriales bacterium]|nr:type II/IV secretion system protein [Terriglobales bacterium]